MLSHVNMNLTSDPNTTEDFYSFDDYCPFCFNETDFNPVSSEVRWSLKLTSLVFYCLTFLLGVPGNAFVVYIAGVKMKRTINTTWFLNLAIADLLCCLSIPFSVVEILLDHHWPYGSVTCKVLPAVVVVNMFASVFTLNLISLDRFAQVITPVWAQNHRNLRLARMSCAVAWFLALCLSLPFMIIRETHTYEDLNVTLCTSHGSDQGDNFQTTGVLSIVRFVFGFLVPLLCIITCYSVIARKLNRSSFRSGRAFRIMLAVIVAFFLCWLPYHSVDLIRIYSGEWSSSVAWSVDPLAVSVAYVNSCLNPVLYVFMGQDFKEKVRLSLRRVFERAFSEDTTHTSPSTHSQQIHSNTLV